MKIVIVFGAFLPVPPARGGAVEKTWFHLARKLAGRGHEVHIISRTWPGWSRHEITDGVHFLRLKGRDHYDRLWKNLLLDFFWSLRVARHLPGDAMVISHNIALPALLRLPGFRLKAPVAVVVGRMPKGQVRAYGGVDRLYAPTSAVLEACSREKPGLRRRMRILPYAIDWHALQPGNHFPSASRVVRIGYAGRIHPEKGLDLLASAAARLATDTTLPPWEIICVGPTSGPSGGGGEDYVARLKDVIRQTGLEAHWQFLPPIWEPASLAAFYQSLDIFCYPSIADQGETFGVSVVESMAAGAAPVVSDLACFRDIIVPEINGLVFAHHAPDAAGQLARQLSRLMTDATLRESLARQAKADARKFDYENVAATLDADLRMSLPESPSV